MNWKTEGLRFSVFNPGNVITGIFGALTPPPDAITVEEAVDYIFQELEKGSLLIVLPQQMRELYGSTGRTATSSTRPRAAWPASAARTTAPRGPIIDPAVPGTGRRSGRVGRYV